MRVTYRMHPRRSRPVTIALGLVLACAATLVSGVVVPVAAECSVASVWPLFQHAAPRARRIAIGTVTRSVRGSDRADGGRITVRIDERVRGRSPSTVVLRDVVATVDCIPAGLQVRIRDRLAIAWAPGGASDGIRGPVSGVAFIVDRESDRVRDGRGASRMQWLTAAHVRQLARLPNADLLLFTADDGTHGRELWRTDGTKAGTRLVRDIVRGAVGSEPRDLVVDRGLAYFSADDGIHGREPWISDGTALGTRMIRDVRPGAAGSDPDDITLMYDGVAFSADDGIHGREPWVSTGTAATTRLAADIRPGMVGSDPREIGYVNGALIMSADDGTHGREPWSVDDEGASLIADVRPGPVGSDPSTAVAYSLDPVFTADDGSGPRVWRATRTWQPDHEGWATLTDVFGDVTGQDADPRGLFVLSDDEHDPILLWAIARRTDGSRGPIIDRPATDSHTDEPRGGVVRLPATQDGDGSWPTPAGRRLFFAADDDRGAPHLWVTEGTVASTYPVMPTDGAPISGIAVLDGLVVVGSRSVDGTTGGLWQGDGTVTGMYHPVDRNLRSPRAPTDLTRVDRWVAFVADRVPPTWDTSGDGVGRELWATGARPVWSRRTGMVRDIRPGPESSDPRDLTWLRATSDLH